MGLLGGDGGDVLIGASGNDVFSGGAGRDRVDYYYETQGVNVTIDGVANDGAGKRNEVDNVLTDVENVRGGKGARDRALDERAAERVVQALAG